MLASRWTGYPAVDCIGQPVTKQATNLFDPVHSWKSGSATQPSPARPGQRVPPSQVRSALEQRGRPGGGRV